MSTTSPLLRLTLQALDENPDTWGNVLNTSAIRLLEDGIAGAADVVLASAVDYTLDDTAGGPSQADSARYMILDVSGSPGGTTNIIVPTRSKIYLVNNQSASSVVAKTAAGTGPTVIAGEAQWVFCDGTNVLAASAATAVTAGTATTAADADALIGVAGSEFAQKGLAQTFTKGQVVQRFPETVNGVGPFTLDLDCVDGNAFYHLTTNNLQLTAPNNATDGQMISLVVEQGGGGPHSISFAASTFIAASGIVPTLSTAAGQIDYFAMEYAAGLSGGAKWIISQIKDVSAI